MKNLTPTPPEQRPAPASFTPVPRLRDRHDGWTPERQRAFIAALADTGSVRTAANMVNMSPESAYALRRHPAAASLRAAWQAAQGMGVLRIKDEAFERALNGQLVPVFCAGKLMGYRRKKNDRLLMFILRHYGATPEQPRHTIRHITARASAAAIATTGDDAATPLQPLATTTGGDQPALAAGMAMAGTNISRTAAAAAQATITTAAAGDAADDADSHAATLAAFAGVPLDAAARAEVLAALAANAVRAAETLPEDNPDVAFVHRGDAEGEFIGEFVGDTDDELDDEAELFNPGEPGWRALADPARLDAIDAAAARVRAAKESGEWERLPVPTPAPLLSVEERQAMMAKAEKPYDPADWE
ncbi:MULTISPECIES: hypothetical protein [unclassified Sphingomonas]|uniref:hypothetical protein n=1 Tax=unclassified Sphingomonas TaxID=196159 RepID=UPI00226A123D|nr:MULTISPECIES: hypothetical protein [unclassified Sphingomonas]